MGYELFYAINAKMTGIPESFFDAHLPLFLGSILGPSLQSEKAKHPSRLNRREDKNE